MESPVPDREPGRGDYLAMARIQVCKINRRATKNTAMNHMFEASPLIMYPKSAVLLNPISPENNELITPSGPGFTLS
jgi:hypothetical protein